ncbi:MAG: hypothetical protein B7Z68_02905 [Acidobacteria bacterium 21-70-11]|nr:MAG: hypothetical protein B7Z68_02905 [Acidobacteria bacterium 21-70-11]HQT93253.1 NPCBM/NEW2 domain-containing protein [Thermoanaerobaculaceae bacterium]
MLALLFLFVVALATRLFHFWEAPYLGFVDIKAHAESALYLIDHGHRWPWDFAWGNVPELYFYTLAPFVKLFAPPVLALKVAVITFSMIALALTYLFLRDLFGSVFALLGIQTLVFGRYFLFYSRYPMEPVDLFMFFVASLLLFRRGMRTNGLKPPILLLCASAFLLACAQYIYLSSRFLIPVFLGYFFAVWPRHGSRRAHALKGLVFFGTFVTLVAPLVLAYVYDREALLVRQNEIGAIGRYTLTQLFQNYINTFLSFLYKPDNMSCQNIPGVCMTNPAIAILLVLGLIVGLVLIKHEAVQLALITIGFTLPATSLTVEPYNSKRVLDALLGVAILTAYPAAYAVARWGPSRRVVRAIPVLMSVVLVGFGVRDFRILFVDFMNSPEVVQYTYYESVMFAKECEKLSKTHEIYLSAGRTSWKYLYSPSATISGFDYSRDVPIGQTVDRDVALVLEREDRPLFPLLRWFYPSVTMRNLNFLHKRGLTLFEIKARDINSALGVALEAWRTGDATPVAVSRLSWTGAALSVGPSLPADFYVLTGLVYLQSPLRLGVEGKGRLQCSIDGEVVVNEDVNGHTSLECPTVGRGWHPWKLTLWPTTPGAAFVLRKTDTIVRLVAKGAPDTGFRQLAFKDHKGIVLDSVAYVPEHVQYTYWGKPPEAFTVFCGEARVERARSYQLRFLSSYEGVLRIGSSNNQRFRSNVLLSGEVELAAGWDPGLIMLDVRRGLPAFSLDLRPALPAISGPSQSAWRPCSIPLSAILADVAASHVGYFDLRSYAVTGYEQDWRSLAVDSSVGDGHLTIGGSTFASGLGTHANSRIDVAFKPGKATFSGACGVDDETGGAGTVVFKIMAAGQTLFVSPLMHGHDKAVRFSVPVAGLSSLVLIVESGGDGIDSDHADWVDLKLQ